MASTFPTALDAFTNPTATSLLTSPNHAQQHSDINDAVEALEAKVAIGATVLGTYTAYTPTWNNLTVGDGTVVSYFSRVNNLVHFHGRLTWGTTTSCSGSINLVLPVAIGTNFGSATSGQMFGFLQMNDVSAGTFYSGFGQTNAGAVSARLRTYNVIALSNGIQASNINNVFPITWAVGDIWYWNFTYEAA